MLEWVDRGRGTVGRRAATSTHLMTRAAIEAVAAEAALPNGVSELAFVRFHQSEVRYTTS
jgi:hypothetical protein